MVRIVWASPGGHHHDQEEADGGAPTGRQGKVSLFGVGMLLQYQLG